MTRYIILSGEHNDSAGHIARGKSFSSLSEAQIACQLRVIPWGDWASVFDLQQMKEIYRCSVTWTLYYNTIIAGDYTTTIEIIP